MKHQDPIKFKTMKNLLLFILLLTGSTSFAQQPGEGNREKIQALKIAFISQKLDLTVEEAQKFWPVYNTYETDLRQILKDNRNNENVIENDEKLLNLRKKYNPDFTRLLGQARVNKLFGAEREFRGVLLKNLKKERMQGQGMRRPAR